LYPKRSNPIGEEVFRVEKLTVAHPYIANKNLVEDVSFSVRAGEVLGMAGLVGAGRSEVCMAIFGMTPVKSGKMFLNGKPLHVKNTQQAVHNGIGLVSEDRKRYGLNFVWDIKNNIAISNLDAISKPLVSTKGIVSRGKKYFDELRIKATGINTKVITLSGGNQQKVVTARTLNSEPRLIILDEPTKGIDVGSKNEIYGLINDMAAKGVAVIMISSELPELMAMSDRFIVMAASGTSTLNSSLRMKRLMVLSALRIFFAFILIPLSLLRPTCALQCACAGYPASPRESG
jgi:D-xylose transport system ATP-binding protein